MENLGAYAGSAGIGALAIAVMAFIRIFLVRQIADLRADVRELTTQMGELEARYDEERGLKHKAYNDVARTVMALDLVQRLARECKCGVLSPLDEIVDRLVNELETIGHRRAGDLPGHTTTTTTTTT